jgi:hypothetical protein
VGNRRHSWLAALIAFLIIGLASSTAYAEKRHKVPDLRKAPTAAARAAHSRIHLPLTVHVATNRGRAVVSSRRVAKWVERANRELRRFGISVSVRAIVPVPLGYGHVTKWRQRRGLARLSPKDGSVHVFVVDRLELFAPRRADRSVRGMHWRYRGVSRKLANREYVVVTSDAPQTTLVHEFGHLLGLRHEPGTNNLMCSCRRGPGQHFTAGQGAKMRSGAGRFIRRQRR